ncbi:sulfite exporter TauE/SafE family protein [Promicromonospora iranensis]|uniref:sulfite exporter TauE/SafE family protein n=1 Tax=Promicromonospora iranensis TaxID=1105144 RepID=UPI0023A9C5F6|nr:sulfite exporter TauE/SafE family protein [Promicromonospora iranensis]
MDLDGGILLGALFALIFVSAILQSLSGFGFALLSAPLLAATIGGAEAVSTIIITGTVCDVAILAMRRSVPRPVGREVWALAGWSVPGMLVGAWLLAWLPASGLQIFVACVVIGAVVLRLRSRERGVVVRPVWAVPAGLLSGALSTSTSLGGPPSVYYLVHRDLAPHAMRDTLVTVSLVRLPLSVASLVIAGTWQTYEYWLPLVGAALLGQLVGARAFHAFGSSRYERVVLCLLVVSALVSVAALLMG